MTQENQRSLFHTGPELSSIQRSALESVIANKEEWLVKIIKPQSQKQTVIQTDRFADSKERALHAAFDPEYEEKQRLYREEQKRLNSKKKTRINPLIPASLLCALIVGAIIFGILHLIAINKPPTADPVNLTIRVGESVKPEDFVTNVNSNFEIISISFVEPPDVLSHNVQAVEIRITDDRDNSATFNATLTVTLNTSPPVIEGTVPIYSRVGNPIVYRQGITARDDFGRELELQVDSSRVDLHTEGLYTVIYFAIDQTGLRTEVRETVQILNVDFEYVHTHIDEALATIINDNMSQLQMVRAIHSWVVQNIQYAAATTDPGTIYEDAYRALRDKSGNCYRFYAISALMLTRAGIDNQPIDRIPGTASRHRWSLVNPDGLGWHHFDTTPTRLGLGAATAFFTDTQARAFTQQFIEFNGTRDFYTFNPELYPEIVQ